MLRKISQPTSPNLFDNIDQTFSKTEDYPSVATNFPSDDPDINEKKAVRSTPEAPYFRTQRTNQDTNQNDNQLIQKSDQTSVYQLNHPQSEDKKVTKIIYISPTILFRNSNLNNCCTFAKKVIHGYWFVITALPHPNNLFH